MHIRAITKAKPAPAQDIVFILDVISQLISVIQRLETFLDFDFSEDILGKTE